MLLANQPHISLRRRRVDHKRSKRGCLTCRVRRKKCPEDFQSWPDGTSACSACYMRGQVCRVPASVAATKLKANSSMRGGLVSSPTVQHTSPIRTSENGQSVPSPANVSNVAQELPNSSSKGPQIPQVYESSHNWRSGETTINSQAGIGPFSQPSWLDTFFDEFMNLTGPVMEQHTQCDDTSETSMVETLADSVSLFSTSSATPVSDNHHALPASRHSVREILNPASKGTHSFHQPKSVLPWSDSIIDQTIRSDDLDELLVRWSPIYETYLCAIADVSTPTGHEPSLLGQLMDVTKSNTMCKASMVACCLAYRDVMLRELQSAKAPSRFVRYLVHGRRRPEEDLFDSERTQDLSYASNSTNTSQFAHAWLRFALEGYRRQRTTMSISPRLLTLLNVRCAAVCILGASDSNKLAPDIAQELSDLEVSVEYLQSTSSSGTMLAFLVSALASANIMDTATIRGARTAIKDTGINVESPSYAPATILKQDLEINPTTVYRYVSSLSMTLLLCMRQISELAADIESGSCLLKSDVEERSTDIQQKIVVSSTVHREVSIDFISSISVKSSRFTSGCRSWNFTAPRICSP